MPLPPAKENAPPAVWFYCGAAILRAAIRTIIRPAVAWLSGRNEPRTPSLLDRNLFLVSSRFIYYYSIILVSCQEQKLDIVRFICVDAKVTRTAFPAIPSHRRLDLLFSLTAEFSRGGTVLDGGSCASPSSEMPRDLGIHVSEEDKSLSYMLFQCICVTSREGPFG